MSRWSRQRSSEWHEAVVNGLAGHYNTQCMSASLLLNDRARCACSVSQAALTFSSSEFLHHK